MNERVELSQRMLAEAEIRLRNFTAAISDKKIPRITDLRRFARLLETSQRNMKWVIEAPQFFNLRHEDVEFAHRMNKELSNLLKTIYGMIYDLPLQRSKRTKNLDDTQKFINEEGNGLLSQAEVDRIDDLIDLLDKAPKIDAAALWESSREQRSQEISRMLSEGLTYGEATNAPPILNQSEENFRTELKAINNDLVEQIKIIEHCLDRWFSVGEAPPPYYAWRVAVILRKAKEHGREREFLRVYLKNFQSLFEGRRDRMLRERAQSLGLEPPKHSN
ncbi:hypothetical protein U4960_08270 [Altererythrobacter sp. H2]|uniref:hypothetical protein n=1 Tax=Altererythrobacter sp. H2 TaxID=3108391 RepID=UPI002B4C027E|nr:hypothetical protein [Altererythrobacter sp. H2]WRK94301.1 hypothetical protein U4960_08270 [Altererythrobacter sp. H2]